MGWTLGEEPEQRRAAWVRPVLALLGMLASPFNGLAQDKPSDTPSTMTEAKDNTVPEQAPESDEVEAEAAALARELGSTMAFDAQSTSFSRDGMQQVLEGEVVAIGAGVLIAADRIIFHRGRQELSASGHVVLSSRDQVFTGESLVYLVESGDFRLRQALMLANDKKAAGAVRERLLGFSDKEMNFEVARKDQLRALAANRQLLAERARREAMQGKGLDPMLVDRYAMLLDQEDLVAGQKNPSLANLAKERREALLRRREFYNQRRQVKGDLPVIPNVYFRLGGERIERTNGNDYRAEESSWTPCRCDGDEAPDWGFRSRRNFAQEGGYVDFQDAVLEIKGIPVLYVPYLKIPIKGERQSGFLMPTFGFESRSGNIYSQPVYLDLGKSRDATLTTDVFENRGTRVGLEYRQQFRTYSGVELRLEGIRDRLWMQDRGVREDMAGLYRDGLATARAQFQNLSVADLNQLDQQIGDPGLLGRLSEHEYYREVLSDVDYWLPQSTAYVDNADRVWTAALKDRVASDMAAIEGDIDKRFVVPSNTWRGAYVWRGMTFLTPRLSLVSNGEVVSDHRYREELDVPDDFNEALFGGRDAGSFSSAKGQMHLDARDLYLGLGGRYGDNVLAEERFQGQQLPTRIKALSRRVQLNSKDAAIPVTLQVGGEFMRISQNGPSEVAATSPLPNNLGDGQWRRLKLDTKAPLLPDTVIQVSHFAEAETRWIDHAALPGEQSRTKSWATGLEFILPIDGKGVLPEAWQGPKDCDKLPTLERQDCEAAQKESGPTRNFAHHIMDFRMRWAVRPVVVREGDYAQPGPAGLAYFASDRFVSPSVQEDLDSDVPEEARMKEQQRVTFSTNHAIKLFRRSFKEAQKAKPQDTDPLRDTKARARRELVRALSRPDPETKTPGPGLPVRGLDGRDYVEDDQYYAEPMRFSAQISYDFLDAKTRQEQQAENAAIEAEADALQTSGNDAGASARRAEKVALAQPWKDPEASLGIHAFDLSFDAAVKYSIYARTARQLSLGLSLPPVLDTTLALGYNLTKKIDLERSEFLRTRERTLSLVTSLLPSSTAYVSLKNQVIDETLSSHRDNNATAIGLEYKSSSDCWGLQLAREKPYGKQENEASYVVRLSVIFMGQNLRAPNMSSGARGQLESKEPS